MASKWSASMTWLGKIYRQCWKYLLTNVLPGYDWFLAWVELGLKYPMIANNSDTHEDRSTIFLGQTKKIAENRTCSRAQPRPHTSHKTHVKTGWKIKGVQQNHIYVQVIQICIHSTQQSKRHFETSTAANLLSPHDLHFYKGKNSKERQKKTINAILS